jgi:hypothetical protein
MIQWGTERLPSDKSWWEVDEKSEARKLSVVGENHTFDKNIEKKTQIAHQFNCLKFSRVLNSV